MHNQVTHIHLRTNLIPKVANPTNPEVMIAPTTTLIMSTLATEIKTRTLDSLLIVLKLDG